MNDKNGNILKTIYTNHFTSNKISFISIFFYFSIRNAEVQANTFFFCFASVNQISYFRVVLLIEKSRLDKNLKRKYYE